MMTAEEAAKISQNDEGALERYIERRLTEIREGRARIRNFVPIEEVRRRASELPSSASNMDKRP